MYRGLFIGILFSLLAAGLFSNTLVEPSSAKIQGIILDEQNQPIIGASIVLLSNSRPIGGGASDNFGRFKISVPSAPESLEIKVTSLGFSENRSVIAFDDLSRPLTIRCSPTSVELSAITVLPSPDVRQMKIAVPSSQVISLSSRSLVVTNPTAAVQYPQLAKIGSAHSSQIRINGTSPIFHLNGIPIGTDPNHFGMFSVVPATIVEQIDFQPQGTDASFSLPSVIDFKTISAFEDRSSTELNFSTLELTGTVRNSTDKRYLIGAARKSVLDQLVNSLDISSQRATIPPTSFGDLFLSTGLKLSSHWQVGLDQYHVNDYLAFNTATTASNSAVQTYQRMREHFVGMRANGLYGKTLVTSTFAVRTGRRSYEAEPGADSKGGAVQINLSEAMATYLGQVGAEIDLEKWQFKAGSTLEYAPNRRASLSQHNWNMLPPFNTSDNPFIYQVALNEQYGEYQGTMTQQSVSNYLSASREFGPVSITSGMRQESFSHLAGDALLGRLLVTVSTGRSSEVSLFYGGFAEDPITNILEPYQVMIRHDAGKLRPIATKLLALDYTHGPTKLSLFHKEMTDLPVVSPDFEQPYVDGVLNQDFLHMRSDGIARFNGGSLALDLPKLLSSKLSFYGSYAYTKATRTDHGVTYPFESIAKHRIQTQFEYTLSRKVKIGSELQVRSGYPYSPTRQMLFYSESSTYNEEFYQNMLKRESSLSFSPNAALNLYVTFTLGAATLNLAITNATNRYNPIISSPSGYVYDSGILPSVGLRWQL